MKSRSRTGFVWIWISIIVCSINCMLEKRAGQSLYTFRKPFVHHPSGIMTHMTAGDLPGCSPEALLQNKEQSWWRACVYIYIYCCCFFNLVYCSLFTLRTWIGAGVEGPDVAKQLNSSEILSQMAVPVLHGNSKPFRDSGGMLLGQPLGPLGFHHEVSMKSCQALAWNRSETLKHKDKSQNERYRKTMKDHKEYDYSETWPNGSIWECLLSRPLEKLQLASCLPCICSMEIVTRHLEHLAPEATFVSSS